MRRVRPIAHDLGAMNEAAYLAVRLAFLALLWLFVLSAVRAVRADLFGPTRRQQRRSAPPVPPRRRRRRGRPAAGKRPDEARRDRRRSARHDDPAGHRGRHHRPGQ